MAEKGKQPKPRKATGPTPILRPADRKTLNPPLVNGSRKRKPPYEIPWKYRTETRRIHGQLVEVKVFDYPLQPRDGLELATLPNE